MTSRGMPWVLEGQARTSSSDDENSPGRRVRGHGITGCRSRTHGWHPETVASIPIAKGPVHRHFWWLCRCR